MRLRRFLLFTAAAVVVGGLNAHTPDSYGSSDNTILVGRLLAADGTPADSVAVEVSKLVNRAPTPGSPVPIGTQDIVVVGTATTDEQGYFSVPATSIDPSVTYEFNADVGGVATMYDFAPTFAAVTGGSPALALESAPAAPDAVVLQAGRGPLVSSTGLPLRVGPNPPPALALQASAANGTGLESAEGTRSTAPPGFAAEQDFGGNDTDADIDYVEPGLEVVDPPAEARAGCLVYKWEPTNKYKYASVPIRAVDTGYHSHQTVFYHTAKSTQVGVALTGVDGDISAGVAYGVEASSGQSNEWRAGNNNLSSKWVTWSYRRYHKYCHVLHTGQYYPVDEYKWAGIDASGGSRSVARIPGIGCPYEQTIRSKTTFDGSVTVTWSGWYSVAGVSLNDKQTQQNEVAVTVRPDPGEKRPRYCGTNQVFRLAAKLKEKE
jgi:hypothetical protein